MLNLLSGRLPTLLAFAACAYVWWHTLKHQAALSQALNGTTSGFPWVFPLVSTLVFLLLLGFQRWFEKRAHHTPQLLPLPKRRVWLSLPENLRLKTARALPKQLFVVSTWVSLFVLSLQMEHLRLLSHQAPLPELIFWLLGAAIVVWPVIAVVRLKLYISRAAREHLRATPYKPTFDQSN